MEQVIFSAHAKIQMIERGASKKEVIAAVYDGEKNLVKHGRIAYRKNFQYNNKWGEKFYHIKQVMPVVKKENSKIIIVTVYTFYF